MREKHQPTTSGGIRSWSYSRLLDYESCAHKAFLKIVKREPDPSGPAAERGVQIHDAAERFVRGEGDFIPELKHFKAEFNALRTQYKQGIVSLEGEWATTRDWQPTDWKSRDAWCRMKLDALTWRGKHDAIIVDYKTGKLFGNEVKHGEQGQLYAVGAFMRYPELEEVIVEFWYLDLNDSTSCRYTRKQGIEFAVHFHNRGARMTDATSFPPRPNMFSCRYCPFSPRAGGQCKAGV